MADLNKDFKIDRNSFQEVLASAFLVQQSKLDKEFVNTVVEIEQLMEKDHFSVDTIADLPVEESPEVPINEGNEGDVTISSQDQPTSVKNWKLPFPSTLYPNHDALTRIPRSVDYTAHRLGNSAGSYSRLDARTGYLAEHRNQAKPAIPAASQDNLDSREGNHQVDVTPPPQVLPKNKNSQISDSLVIYQNGRVIFRTDPASGSAAARAGQCQG